MWEATRLMDIYKHLQKSGFEVYFPGQKQTECKKPYIVIKDAGTVQYNTYSSTQTTYYVMCYMPREHFTKLEQFVTDVKEAMKELQPMIMPLYTETASFYDDSVKAYMISVSYRIMKKVNARCYIYDK